MHTRKLLVVFALFLGLASWPCPMQAGSPQAGGDLDDAIAIDDDITSYDSLKKIDKNINFMILNQWSRSLTTRHRIKQDIQKGDILVNSIKLAPGTTVHGDLTIIDTSHEDHIAISPRK